MSVVEVPRDPFNYGINFKSTAERVREEREQRIVDFERCLPFYHPILDDYFRAIVPGDVILLAGVPGAGKTKLARSIATSNARKGKRVHYFALEAERNEIERRTKFSVMAGLVAHERIQIPGGFNYVDWRIGRCEPYLRVGDRLLDDEADKIVAEHYKTLHTLYRDRDFTGNDVGRLFQAIADQTDLIVLDHLHYVDIEDENENRGFKKTVKIIRDTALVIGKPVILVVHIRKLDPRMKRLVPNIDDIHGSSDIAKICTRAIMFAPAGRHSLDDSGCETLGAATFFSIPKCRLAGAMSQIALCDFNWRARKYEDTYVLGYPSRSGDKFEPMTLDAPVWARGHRPPASKVEPPYQDGRDS